MVALTGTEAGLRLDLDRFLLDLRGLAAELGAEQALGIPDLKCARINLWWDLGEHRIFSYKFKTLLFLPTFLT